MTAQETVETTARFTLYSTGWCGFCARLKSQLGGAGIEYDEVDIERQPDAAEIVTAANNGNRTVPTLVYPDGTSQTNPSLAEVQEKLCAL